MPYNPNGATQEIEIPTPADELKRLANPATYIYWQFARPKNWDPSQGFRGFGFSGIFRHKQSIKLLSKSYKRAFKAEGLGKITQTFGASYNALKGQVKGKSGKYIDYSTGWGRRTLREGRVTAGRLAQVQDAIYNELLSTGKSKHIVDREASKLAKNWLEKGFISSKPGAKRPSVDLLKNKIYRKVAENKGLDAGNFAYKKLGKYSMSAIGKARLLKIGMIGMKAASWAGIASLAWGIASAVGEPIGRGIISTANEALTSYEQRFMPEVGGKLRLSYLTRGAATERQRAIEAISKANINGRSAFGQESMYLHQ